MKGFTPFSREAGRPSSLETTSYENDYKGATGQRVWWKRHQNWSRKKKIVVLAAMILSTLILGLGLGVGLGLGLPHNSRSTSSASSDTSVHAPTVTNATGGVYWKPAAGTTWQIQLSAPITSFATDVTAYDFDLFDNPKTTVTKLHNLNRKAICYFSAGSYENWRSDASQFKAADLGKNLDGWAGEKWLNITSPNVRKIMAARLDLAVTKGCDAVDPDNVDVYDNDNGLGITAQNSVDYMGWLAKQAHSRGLAIGLKNAGAIASTLLPYVEFSVNEQCVQYSECDLYQPFITANKPVFHIEYPKGDSTNNVKVVSTSAKTKACKFPKFSTVIKNMNLDSWVEYC